ncbi:4'-phosphopantetheinyl transferase family protein [Albimonas pacifica]|uniref:Enterobactin synthase component D n=1 Tax=Albimonas pacifica TaxID=1114924 RepID=A0A1I3DC10_9RHOB|nr:4'-phosphopantetheinyl transferase superfamily protein [Albimonas pacifica]SFH84088.1 enterobactin synthetase component D [Albimonas pacifica]
MTAISIADVGDRPLIPAPGVVWRACRFRAAPATGLVHDGPQGAVSLTLPPDLLRAVDRRRSEFLAGRLCAALALRALGAPEAVGRDGRAPVWPEGVRGSISHAGDLALAVAARGAAGLGVDCEARFSPDLAAEVGPGVLTAADRAARPPDWDEAWLCTLAFSAKEALYKALSPRLDDVPDFAEARIERIDAAALTLVFRGARTRVAYRLDAAHCVTLAHLP